MRTTAGPMVSAASRTNEFRFAGRRPPRPPRSPTTNRSNDALALAGRCFRACALAGACAPTPTIAAATASATARARVARVVVDASSAFARRVDDARESSASPRAARAAARGLDARARRSRRRASPRAHGARATATDGRHSSTRANQ